jgi:hypothetical protein
MSDITPQDIAQRTIPASFEGFDYVIERCDLKRGNELLKSVLEDVYPHIESGYWTIRVNLRGTGGDLSQKRERLRSQSPFDDEPPRGHRYYTRDVPFRIQIGVHPYKIQSLCSPVFDDPAIDSDGPWEGWKPLYRGIEVDTVSYRSFQKPSSEEGVGWELTDYKREFGDRVIKGELPEWSGYYDEEGEDV